MSIMRLTAGLDSGPVCLQAREPIRPDDDYGTLAARLESLGAELLVRALDERPPFAFVLIEGTATLSENLEEVKAWATRIGGRYMGSMRAKEYGARNGVPGELLVRVRPTRVVAQSGIAD